MVRRLSLFHCLAQFDHYYKEEEKNKSRQNKGKKISSKTQTKIIDYQKKYLKNLRFGLGA